MLRCRSSLTRSAWWVRPNYCCFTNTLVLGEINVPGVLLLLGASLAFGPKLSASLGDTDQKLTPKIIALNVVARLAIMGGRK